MQQTSDRPTRQSEPPEPLALGIEDAALAVGISGKFMRKLVRAGTVPHVKIGERIVIRRATLEKLLAEWERTKSPEESNGRRHRLQTSEPRRHE